MPVTYEDDTSAIQAAGASTWTLDKPAATAEDDLLVAFLLTDTGSNITGAPAGWTLEDNVNVAADVEMWIYSKLAGAAEAASWDWTFDTNETGLKAVVALRGVDLTTPISASSGQDSGSTNAPETTSETTQTDDFIVCAWGAQFPHQADPYTPPVGMTQRVELADSGDNMHMMIGTETIVTGGATSRTATAAATDRHYAGIIVVESAALGGGGEFVKTGGAESHVGEQAEGDRVAEWAQDGQAQTEREGSGVRAADWAQEAGATSEREGEGDRTADWKRPGGAETVTEAGGARAAAWTQEAGATSEAEGGGTRAADFAQEGTGTAETEATAGRTAAWNRAGAGETGASAGGSVVHETGEAEEAPDGVLVLPPSLSVLPAAEADEEEALVMIMALAA